ncbi:hypothetical protein GCM10009823_02720 [Brevibacterium salitolerans]|uniref:Uncharacterized protein n=1 Tax=Brevibacterium salitolerans TaxID=1403566 RepID=A0ABN2WAP1_9MICO
MKKFAYHCSEKPLGGNESDLWSLKLSGITTRVGATSHTPMKKQTTHRVMRLPLRRAFRGRTCLLDAAVLRGLLTVLHLRSFRS